jgi:hypothetical protein
MKIRFVKNLRIADVVIAALGMVLIALFSFRIYAPSGAAARLVVEGEGRRWDFPLDAAETLSVAGPLGDTVVELRGRQARIVSSPCPNQSCIAAGAIHRRGQWIACLPNRVMVRLESEAREGQDLDAASW